MQIVYLEHINQNVRDLSYLWLIFLKIKRHKLGLFDKMQWEGKRGNAKSNAGKETIGLVGGATS